MEKSADYGGDSGDKLKALIKAGLREIDGKKIKYATGNNRTGEAKDVRQNGGGQTKRGSETPLARKGTLL